MYGKKGMRNLMKQAQEMQESLARQMEELEVEGVSGGGMVRVSMKGSKEVLSVQIDPEVMDPEENEMLGELLVAAFNEAGRKVDEKLQGQLGGMAGGLMGGL